MKVTKTHWYNTGKELAVFLDGDDRKFMVQCGADYYDEDLALKDNALQNIEHAIPLDLDVEDMEKLTQEVECLLSHHAA